MDNDTRPVGIEGQGPTLSEWAAFATGQPSAIVISVAGNGDIRIEVHNLNHQRATLALATAIHAVLSQHDAEVLNGAAGADVQARFAEMARERGDR